MKYYMSKNDWYSDWEKEHDDWLEYLARDTQPTQSPTTETPQQQTSKGTNQQKELGTLDDYIDNLQGTQNSPQKTSGEYKQMSLFEMFPDGFIKQEVMVKKASPKKTKKTKAETKNDIMKTATELKGEWNDLDEVIVALENAAKQKNNIFIDFHGEKLYSLIDNKNSCYEKVTGLDYESYCRFEPYIDEM